MRRCSSRAKRSARSATASPMAATRFPPRSRVKAIEIYRARADLRKAAQRAPLFQARLKALGEHPLVGEARGLGLIGGVELVADKSQQAFVRAKHGVGARTVRFAEEEGLIVRSVIGDVLTLSPPLVISATRDRGAVRPS